jgi:hypothetical protein
MPTGFITCVLMCCTHVFAPTDEWNDTDKASLTKAQSRCVEVYPKSPCLTRFIKMEMNVYRAYCGENNK